MQLCPNPETTRLLRTVIAATLLAGAAIHAVAPAFAGAATIITVNSTGDSPRPSQVCQLRDAIAAANSDTAVGGCTAGTGHDIIQFDLGPGNPQINVGAVSFPLTPQPLPDITAPVTIEGATGGATRVVLHGPGTTSGIGPGLHLTAGASGSTIRNLVINNFQGRGLVIEASNVQVGGNFIGTDATGTLAMPNSSSGLLVFGSGNAIGGTTGTTPGGACTGDCNLLSSNGIQGILFRGSNHSLRGNFIGTNVTGDAAIANPTGIYVFQASNVRIGDTQPAGRNVISGNLADGITISASVGTQVLGNYIGTATDGVTPLPNGGSGAMLQGATVASTVGGSSPGAGNVIAFNASGVQVLGDEALNNAIRGNSIHDNVGLGIDNQQNGAETVPPVIILGQNFVGGTACGGCVIDVYDDPADEGTTWLGATSASAAGSWVLGVPPGGPHITATATPISGWGTSEFSAPFSCPDFNQNGLCDGVDDIDQDGVSDALDNCLLTPNPNQRDTDADRHGNICDADLNNDGSVNFADLALFRSRFGTTDPHADFDGSGMVNFADLAIFRPLFGQPLQPPGAGD